MNYKKPFEDLLIILNRFITTLLVELAFIGIYVIGNLIH